MISAGAKRRLQRLRGFLLALIVPLLVGACAGQPRPTPPIRSDVYALPWGAVRLERKSASEHDPFRDELMASVRARAESKLAAGGNGVVNYRVLVISGGGSRGAYGAGVLTGWSQHGDRPEFDVVTGVSTGALMASHAFLGSSFDDGLQMYRDTTDEDVFRKRGKFAALTEDAVLDTAPLRNTLATMLTEDVVRRVAQEHAKGRRLFIGTTNLDAKAFTIWDMGAIASSGRPDSVQRYRDVVLASASFPIAFPPVYFEVERPDGSRYSQMHADGGLRETVFFYDFLDEWHEVLRALGVGTDRVHPELYLLNNDRIHARAGYRPVEGTTVAIAGASIDTLMRQTLLDSLYRLWVTALSSRADFNIAFIPPEFELSDNSLHFDNDEMERLYQLGVQRAKSGQAWLNQKAPDSLEELRRLVNPRNALERLETRPWVQGQ
jgi:predicted acylesterase/phospholipase RssA